MTDDLERINADFITLARNDYFKKVNELRNAEIVFYDNQNLIGESEFLEFGYKHQDGNTVHTVADFGCIWKHFEALMIDLRDIVRKETIQEGQSRNSVCNAGILNADGDYIGPCGKSWPCKDHNGYVG